MSKKEGEKRRTKSKWCSEKYLHVIDGVRGKELLTRNGLDLTVLQELGSVSSMRYEHQSKRRNEQPQEEYA